MALRWFTTILLLSPYICEAYKILVIFPMPGKSHGILGDAVVRHLVEAGHEVTYVTPFPKEDPPRNIHQVDVNSNRNIFSEDTLDIKAILNNEIDIRDRDFLFHMMANISASTVKNENVQKLLRDPRQQFDVIVAEWMFSDIYSAIPPVFGCPLVWFSSIEPHSIILSLVDEPLNPAYNADFSNGRKLPFTFAERVKELWSQITTGYKRNFLFFDIEKTVYEKYISPILTARGKPTPSYEELRYNASLVLGNSHVSTGQATRLPQSYKTIGGYHVDNNVKPLPENLQKIMNSSENGVIYFSMGSNLKSKDLPVELKMGILKMFSNMKQTVIWKFEEDFPDLPKNIHVLKWAPQQSILSHPNCRLFITHGGLLSTTEAIHFGVPIIGIPVFADQFSNVDRAVTKDFALKVDLSYTMVDKLKAAIEKILSDPKYSETAKQLSSVYHDRVVPPGVELVHWVEHVARTRGAAHLRSPALHVPAYQKMYLDLIAVILVLVFSIKTALSFVFCRITLSNNIKNKID